MKLAFERAARTAYLEDLDAAWKLAEDDLKVVDVHDDGTVDTDRLVDVVAHVAHRYPYLVQEEETASEGYTYLYQRQTHEWAEEIKSQLDAEALTARFPALRPENYWR